MLLEGRVAIVTGGAKGMGRAICERFAQEGAKVTIADISMPEAEETLRLVEAAGGQGLVVKCDVTGGEQVKQMVAATIKAFGKLDILVGALKIGLDILFDQEKVKIDQILGHGGFFKTAEVGQKMMAAAMNVPVSVMETAGEGGAWGIALLAAYMRRKATNEPLEAYLSNQVFAGENSTTIDPDPRDVDGFATFMARYKKGLVIERAAVDGLR